MTTGPRIPGTRRPAGTGTVERRPNGRWQARLSRTFMRQGDYLGRFDTRAEAEAAVAKAIAERDST